MKTLNTPLRAVGSYFDDSTGRTIGKVIEYKGSSLKDDAVKVAEANALCSTLVHRANVHSELLEALRRAHYQTRNRETELMIKHGRESSKVVECAQDLAIIESAIKRALGEV